MLEQPRQDPQRRMNRHSERIPNNLRLYKREEKRNEIEKVPEK